MHGGRRLREGGTLTMRPGMRTGVLGLVALFLLFRTSLLSAVAPEVFSSDAALFVGAVVSAPLGEEESVWLWARA